MHFGDANDHERSLWVRSCCSLCVVSFTVLTSLSHIAGEDGVAHAHRDVPPPADPPPPLIFGALGLQHERQTKTSMKAMHERERPILLSSGRKWYFVAGDEHTQSLMHGILDTETEQVCWLDGLLHEELSDIRMCIGLLGAVIGQEAVTAYGFATAAAIKTLLRAGDTHKAREFVHLWEQAQLRVRAEEFLCAMQGCVECMAAVKKLLALRAAADAKALEGLLPRAQQLIEAAAARQQQPQHSPRPASNGSVSSAAKRRKSADGTSLRDACSPI
jgi:hypothetical protein